jgi:lipoprotein-releasing system ATP-binding protein
MKYRSGSRELVVFSKLNFAVYPGERVAVTGASGAGKSTLLHLLGALDYPSEGTVWFEGVNIFAMSEPELAALRNRRIGYVWQQQSLLPEFTALENVSMPLLVSGQDRAPALRAAAERLEEVGLKDRAGHRAGELSGGEQQRVALARALVRRPSLLLADEPTGNLDHDTAEAISSLLASLHSNHGLTSLIVTHNLQFAQSCDRVLQLKGGSLLSLGNEISRSEVPEQGRLGMNDGRSYV